jgi:hypothetical protein
VRIWHETHLSFARKSVQKSVSEHGHWTWLGISADFPSQRGGVLALLVLLATVARLCPAVRSVALGTSSVVVLVTAKRRKCYVQFAQWSMNSFDSIKKFFSSSAPVDVLCNKGFGTSLEGAKQLIEWRLIICHWYWHAIIVIFTLVREVASSGPRRTEQSTWRETYYAVFEEMYRCNKEFRAAYYVYRSANTVLESAALYTSALLEATTI